MTLAVAHRYAVPTCPNIIYVPILIHLPCSHHLVYHPSCWQLAYRVSRPRRSRRHWCWKDRDRTTSHPVVCSEQIVTKEWCRLAGHGAVTAAVVAWVLTAGRTWQPTPWTWGKLAGRGLKTYEKLKLYASKLRLSIVTFTNLGLC